jgi:hypothetical protein
MVFLYFRTEENDGKKKVGKSGRAEEGFEGGEGGEVEGKVTTK